MKTKPIKTGTIKSGIELPLWLHEVFGKTARLAGRQMKEAHAEASLDWVRKMVGSNASIKAFIEAEANESPEIKTEVLGRLSTLRKQA